jgi:hypothetical protein
LSFIDLKPESDFFGDQSFATVPEEMPGQTMSVEYRQFPSQSGTPVSDSARTSVLIAVWDAREESHDGRGDVIMAQLKRLETMKAEIWPTKPRVLCPDSMDRQAVSAIAPLSFLPIGSASWVSLSHYL